MNAIPHNFSDIRDRARRNMLLTAFLRRGTEQAPVKIRNMSALGALIDGPIVPEPNSKVELIRGHYVAEGRVVWSEAKRCGIRFLSELSVNDWLAPLEAQPIPSPSPHSLLDQHAAGGDLSEQADGPRGLVAVPVEDLLLSAKLVEQTARTLARDPRFLREHLTEGRNLIRAMQMLAKMCERTSI